MDDQEKQIRKDYLGTMLGYLIDKNFGIVDQLKTLRDEWETNPQEALFYQLSLQLMEGMNRANTYYLEWKELEASQQNDPSQP